MSSESGVTNGKTLKYEETLPSLPVPPLKQTCNKYLESVKPCVSDEEFLITEAKVIEFCKGVGPVLQKKLLERALHSKNWLEKWWEECAYTRPRYPIAPTVNIGGPLVSLEDIWPAKVGTQITRTAIMVYFTLKEWKVIYSQERPIDFSKGDTPLSMSQYYNLFSWCRIPEHTIDSYVAAFKPAPAPTANYITVITKGRIYKCNVLNAQLDPISIPEMETQLKHIAEDACRKPLGPGLGSLTSENRSLWAKERDYLLSCDSKHNEMLETIQNSILTVVLDDASPSSVDEFQLFVIGGNCYNRWFDKSLQFIAFKNGLLGFNIDHLSVDAVVEIVTILRVIDNIREYWNTRKQKNSVTQSRSSVVKPMELEFKLDHRLHQSIEAATKQFQSLCANMVIKSLIWNKYGKELIKKFKLHPDTFVQMAIQLADYKLHKRVASTYETASTRQFYHGRTETVRSHTKEVQSWCKAMENLQATAAHKVKLLRIACLRHDELMKEASDGLGIDRHLLGLRIIAEECGLPTPEIFTDTSWKKSGGDGNFTLSTSLVGYYPVSVFGSTLPMIEDGYGLYYSIQDKRITITETGFLSSKVTDCERFQESLWQSLFDMQSILVESKL